MLHNKRSHLNEKASRCNYRETTTFSGFKEEQRLEAKTISGSNPGRRKLALVTLS